MNTTDLVHRFLADAPLQPAATRTPLAPSRHQLAIPVRTSIFRSRCHLVRQQRVDGSWAGQRSGDISSLIQFVLLSAYLGQLDSELVDQSIESLKRDEHPNGGWSLVPGGPIDLNASVLAYFALKVAGQDGSQQLMGRARQVIRELGGADAANSATRWWLALLGQIDYDHCPEVAPEWLLASMFHSHADAASERRLAAMAIVAAKRPRRIIDVSRGVRELFIEQPTHWPKQSADFAPPQASMVGEIWSRCERVGLAPFRKRALERARFLLTELAVELGCQDAELEELAWHWIALKALGFQESSPAIVACQHRLDHLVFVDSIADESRSQPETALTADTALAIEAIRASGVAIDQPPVAAGIRWLVEHRVAPVEAAHNDREMAAVLRAIAPVTIAETEDSCVLPPVLQVAIRADDSQTELLHHDTELAPIATSIADEFVARQRFDGGWSPWSGAESSRRSRGMLRASFRRPLEVSSADATAATLVLLAEHGVSPSHPAMIRGGIFLRQSQRGDGSWDSATGARFLHGTTWAIRGLLATGAPLDDSAVAAGLNWLVVQQHESGGWGEALGSSANPREFVRAEATAIQTAWVVLALVAAGHADHEATRRGIEFLVGAQQDDGRWYDSLLSVRDSAGGSWYRNDLHSAALPLLALARWAVAIGQLPLCNESPGLRLVCDESLN